VGLTNNGKDVVARALGGVSFGISDPAATGSSATTLTDTGAAFAASSGGPPAQGGLVGQLVVATSTVLTYGVILSNTSTVLTVDQWHDWAAPESTLTTPSTTTPYAIVPGGAPCFYMGVTANATAFNATDATLAAEIWTSGGGIRRRLATWAHTTGTATYTIANTFTVNGSDTGLPITIAKIGIFQHFVNAAVTTSNSGQMLFETVLSSSAVLSAIGDNVAITDTVTIS
jgi:hypothetical protein